MHSLFQNGVNAIIAEPSIEGLKEINIRKKRIINMIEEMIPNEIFRGYAKSMPNNAKWQSGKTYASIKFVQDAEKLISELQAKAGQLKAGREVLHNYLDIEEYVLKHRLNQTIDNYEKSRR